MAGEWSTATIAECAANEPYSTQIGPFGEKIRAEMYTAAGAPILRGTNVNTEERFHDDDFVFMDSEVAEKEFSKFVCEADDVILCHKGTLGKIGIVPKHSRFKRYIMGNSMMKVRCDRRKLEPSFLYYWLTSQDGHDYLFSRVSQVGVPQIQRPLTTLREATIPLPPLPEQRAIVHILGTLDDKIELSRRMNETLEAMARALFKSWFVDFDPVRAKAIGRDPGLPKSVADLFPARLVDSELGEIPEGWQTGPILDHARLMSGGTPKTDRSEYWDGSIAWASAKDVSQSPGTFLVATERTITEPGLDESATQMIPAFCSVVVARGATTGRMVLLGCDVAMNQTCYALASTTETPFSLYCRLRVEIDDLVHAAHGSVFDTITTSTFTSSRIVLPPKALLRAFEDRSAPLFLRVLESTRETSALAALRNALLPKLISGDVRVNHAENFVGRGA